MKFFVDTAEIDDIKDMESTGLLDGVTTNPSLIAKSGRNFIELIGEICKVVDGPVSAEVAAMDYPTMLKEAEKLAAIADNVAVKVPLTEDGLKVCKAMSDNGTMVNVTLCFSAGQAILAAKAGAAFISPFVGRLDDICYDGMDLIGDICHIYSMYPEIDTEVLVASVRNPTHIITSAKLGADVVTCPPNVIKQLYKHPLTDKGLAAFVEDWKKQASPFYKTSKPLQSGFFIASRPLAMGHKTAYNDKIKIIKEQIQGKILRMKDIFKKVATALDNFFFVPPRLELNDGQKKFLEKNDYKVIRAQMPVVMSAFGVSTVTYEFDLIQTKDGANLSPQEYEKAEQVLAQYKEVPPPELHP